MLKSETEAAIREALRAGLSPFEVVPPLPLSEWAEQNFRLSAESSHMQGRWTCWPFQRGWMDALSDDDVSEVVVRKSKRTGYTKALLAFIGYTVAHRRRKMAVYQPTDDDALSFTKGEIDPMLRDVPAVAAVALKGHADTMKMKLFRGGSVLHILGGRAARAFRRITVSAVAIDELDAFDESIEKSGDPVTLARGRLEGAAFPKIVVGSTPRLKGVSLVEAREQAADARLRYVIPCPHCGVEHPLEWGGKDVQFGMKWDDGDPKTVRHICPHCHGSISQSDYLSVWGGGAWVSDCGAWRYGSDGVWRDADDNPTRPPRHIAFAIWAAYSPQREWSDIVREFLQATARAKAGDTAPLQAFVTESLGEYWEEVFERVAEHELARRAEDYKLGTAPAGVLVVTAGVDVQDDRFEVVVWGWGRGEESWVIDYRVIYADPSDERHWGKLDDYLRSEFRHASGRGVKIEATAIDTGGHHTHQVYNFCRRRPRTYAVKGAGGMGRPIKNRAVAVDVNHRGQVLRKGATLWHVGVDAAKDLVHGRLQVKSPGPGYMHFSRELGDAFYSQLVAEKRQRIRTSRGLETRWVLPSGARNEVLDCSVYALFAAHVIGVHTASEGAWRRREQQLLGQPMQSTAPAAEAVAPPPPPPRPAPRPTRRVGRMVPFRW